MPEGLVEKHKGWVVAKGFSQIPGIHYKEIFASTACMVAMHTVMATTAAEDMELESVNILTAFLNKEIDTELYIRIPEGLKVEGEPKPGEDPKQWVLWLLKGLYGISEGPRIWALKLHLVLTMIGSKWINCDHSVYIYQHGNARIIMPIHVDDLLITLNSKTELAVVKSELAANFKIHNQGLTKSILSIKIKRDWLA